MRRITLIFSLIALLVILVACQSTEKFKFTVEATAGGTVSGTESGSYEKGTDINITATANEGFVFEGWFKGNQSVSTTTTYSFKLEEEVSLVAKFKTVVKYTFNVSKTEGGSISGSQSGSYNEKTQLTVIATANEGYKFDGWFSGQTKVSELASYTFTLAANTDLKAQFSVSVLPTQPVVTNVEYDSLTQKITWDQVTGATEYVVSATVHGTQTVSIPSKVVNTNELSILGLNAVKHEVTIIAKGVNNVSLDSAPVKYVLTIEKHKLASVEDLVFDAEKDLITWNDVADSDGYLVEVKKGTEVVLSSDGEIKTNFSTYELGKGQYTVEVTAYAKLDSVYHLDSDVEVISIEIAALGELAIPENLMIKDGYLTWGETDTREVLVKVYELYSTTLVESTPVLFDNQHLFLNDLVKTDGSYTVGIQFKSNRHDTELSQEVKYSFTVETLKTFTAEEISKFSGETVSNGEHAAVSLVTVGNKAYGRVVPTADGWGRVASETFNINFSKNPVTLIKVGTVIGGYHMEMIANGSKVSVLGDTSSQQSRNVSLFKEGLVGPGTAILRLGVNQATGVGASEVSVDYELVKVSYVYEYEAPVVVEALEKVEGFNINFLGFVAWTPVMHADSYKYTLVKDDVTVKTDELIEVSQLDLRTAEPGVYTLTVKAHSKENNVTSEVSESYKVEVKLVKQYNAAEISTFSGENIEAGLDPENSNLAIVNVGKATTYGWIYPSEGITLNMDKNPFIITRINKVDGGYFYFGLFDNQGHYPYKGDTPGSISTSFTAIYRANVNVDRQTEDKKDFNGIVTGFKVKPGVWHAGGANFSQMWIESISIVYVEEYVESTLPTEVQPLATPSNLAVAPNGLVSWSSVTGPVGSPEVKYVVTITNKNNEQETFSIPAQLAASFSLASFNLAHGQTYVIEVKALGDATGEAGADLWYAESEAGVLEITYNEVIKTVDFSSVISTVVKTDGDFESAMTLGTGNSLIFSAPGTGWNRMALRLDASTLGAEIVDGKTVAIVKLGNVTGNPAIFYGFTRSDNGIFENIIGDTSVTANSTLINTGWVHPLMVTTPETGTPYIELQFGYGGVGGADRSFEVLSIVIAKYDIA